MPEIEHLRFPSREGKPNLQDQGDLQAVCPGRRRSCALVNTPSPCVNKAVSHIQELKRKLEDWCQQPGYVQRRMSHEKQQNSKTLRFHSSDSDTDSLISTELYIEGIGLSARESGPLTSLRKETTDVLVEVVYLIERLEADRQTAEEALQVEKSKGRTLGKKIDCISLWKQQEFPVAVQREHEACIRDISELKWHLRTKREKLEQVRDRLIHTEVLNQRLQEDIDYVQKHGPLVKEKLELESDIMTRIKTAQREANESYAKNSTGLKSAKDEMMKEQEAAQKERKEMAHILNSIRNQLRERLDELEQLQGLWEANSSAIKDMEEKVALKGENCAVMSLRIPELVQQETAINDLVLELRIEINEEVGKVARVKEEIAERLNKIQEARLAGEAEISHLEEVFRKKRQALLALFEENRELEMEIEDYSNRIHDSENAVKKLQKDRKRMLLKVSQNEEQRDQAKEELSLVAALHADTKTRLEEQEQLTFMEERRIRKVTEDLKRQMMSEMKALATLKSKIAKVKEELQEEKMKSKLAEQELKQEFEEALSDTRQLEVEMEDLRKIHSDRSKTMASLTEKLNEIKSEHQRTSDILVVERNRKCAHLNDVKEQHKAVTARYDRALSRINELTAKSIEYRAASDQMDQAAANMPAVIDELQSVMGVVEFKNQTAMLVMNALQSDAESYQQRTERWEESHAALFAVRQQDMRDTKEALKTALEENAALAAEYRELQKALLVARREAVCVFDEKNRAEASVHDRNQLSLLQKRMHMAVVKYFKQRSLHSQAELAHFQVLSNQNNQNIANVQEELSKAIQRISAFLHSLTDGSAATDDGADNKQAGPDAGGLNKKTPTVQIAV